MTRGCSWPEVTIKDICSAVQYGYTASGSMDVKGPYFLRITDVAQDYIDWKSVPRCDISPADHAKFQLQDGDIVVARTGATVGYGKLLRNPPDAVFASYLVRLRVKPGVDAKFVGSIVESDAYKAWVKSQAGGAAQPNANAQVLAAFPLRLPPLDLQRRVASILGAYDDLIEVNRRRIAVLEEMARRLFEEWFVHLRFPGRTSKPPMMSNSFELPDGWRTQRFGELADEVRDAVDPKIADKNTPYVGLEHIPRRSTTLGSWGLAGHVVSTKLRFQRGDVLFGKIRPYFHKVVWAPFDGFSSSDAIIWRPRSHVVAALVLAVASSDAFVAHSVQTSNGTKMPRANPGVLARYPVPVPPYDLLRRFNQSVLPGVELAASLQFANKKLAESRDLLLPRLVSGELSVSTAERGLEAVA